MTSISIVTTLYRSEGTIREFYDRALRTLEAVGLSEYEFIFVDDGSPDGSVDIVNDIMIAEERVKLIELSRNFGHHRALACGLDHADGDYVFLLDSDLEEAPELLVQFYDILTSSQVDVVYGVQKKRRGSLLDRLLGGAFFWVLEWASPVKIDRNVITARLMTKNYLRAFKQFCETETSIGVVFALVGFKQQAVAIEKIASQPSTYTLAMKARLALEAILGVSDRPLFALFFFGMIMSFLSFLFAFILVIQRLVIGTDVPGWTAMAVAIFFAIGLQSVSSGLLGVYLGNVYREIKQRPRYVVSTISGLGLAISKTKRQPKKGAGK